MTDWPTTDRDGHRSVVVTVAVLGVLVLTGPLILPSFAANGELIHPLLSLAGCLVVPAAVTPCPGDPTASSSPR